MAEHDDPTQEPRGDEPVTPQVAPPVRPVDLRDHVRFSPDHATRVRVFATDHLAYDLWCIEPRQSTPVLHHPDHDTTYTVIGGRSWFVTDQGEIGLDPLGAMLVPAGVVHGIDNRAADPLIVFATSSPPSDDAEDEPPVDLRAAIHVPATEPGLLRRVADAVLGPGRGNDPGQGDDPGRGDDPGAG